MARPARMTEAEVEAALAALPGWARVEGREAIARTYTFKDFSAAWGWMNRVALAAETMDHHPEWRNVWNRVEVVLTTHDPKGLTALDFDLARAMDRLAGVPVG